MQFAGHLGGAIEGARVLVQSALALAVTIATALALARMPMARLARIALIFCLAAVAIGGLTRPVPADAVAALLLIVLGALVATGMQLQGATIWTAIVAGGIAAGLAGKMQTASLNESIGGAAVLFLLVLLVGLLARIPVPERLQRAAALARRMAGAWLSAVGILLIALSLRGAA